MALAVSAGAQTTTQFTFTLLGTGTGTLSSFSLTGAGVFQPAATFGPAKVTVTGGTTSGKTIDFSVTFQPSGATFNASCSSFTTGTTTVAGTQEATLMGTAAITGGTGAYAQASGSFNFSMSLTPATAQSPIFFTGSGSITTGSSTGGGGSGNQPAVNKNGILNAASDAFVGLPNSSIAQGSIFSIYGTKMGPSSSPSLSFPLLTTLGGVSVNVTSGGTTVKAIPMFVGPNQINAVLPGNTPTGSATLTVAYNGQSSAPASFQVVASSFGVFTTNSQGSGPGIITNSNYQVLTLTSALHPGDVGIIWGTGIGASPGDDGSHPPLQTNLTNINVSVYVGTTPATVLYRGRSFFTGEDQINFMIPSGVLGCHVPVAVQIGKVVSNFPTMPIAPAGTNVCSDPTGPTGSQLTGIAASGTVRTGGVGLNRSTSTTPLPTQGTQTTINDGGSAAFDRYTYQQVLSANPFQTFTFGACTVYTFAGETAAVPTGVQPTFLDAGPSITVTGPNGTKQLPRQTSTFNNQTTIGYYAALGSNASGQQLYLSPGSYTVSGPGGADVGAFSQTFTVPTSLTWTNSGSISTVDRAAGQLITWTGGDPNSEVVIDGDSLVLGTAPDGSDSVGGFFYCTVQQSALQFTIPPVILLSLPASVTTPLIPIPLGTLVVSNQIEIPMTIPNIDFAYFGFAAETSQSVTFQ